MAIMIETAVLTFFLVLLLTPPVDFRRWICFDMVVGVDSFLFTSYWIMFVGLSYVDSYMWM